MELKKILLLMLLVRMTSFSAWSVEDAKDHYGEKIVACNISSKTHSSSMVVNKDFNGNPLIGVSYNRLIDSYTKKPFFSINYSIKTEIDFEGFDSFSFDSKIENGVLILNLKDEAKVVLKNMKENEIMNVKIILVTNKDDKVLLSDVYTHELKGFKELFENW
ncbi:MAG: hypothetical protein ACRCX2_34395 [Paraclostridium sp.]